MSSKTSVVVIVLFMFTVLLAGCNPGPDLVVSPAPNDVQYCNRDSANGNLVVGIHNQGNAAAGGSMVKVDFGSHGAQTAAVAPLDAGATTSVSMAIPSGCFDSDCEFKITVDSDNAVSETNETNNSVDGRCIG